MMKHLIAGTAMIAMMTAGVAYAESESSSTTVRSTVTTPAAPDSYSATHTERSVNEDGVQVQKKETYRSGTSGSSSSSFSKTVDPSGAEVKTYHEENSSIPAPVTTTTKRSTTTTTTGDE